MVYIASNTPKWLKNKGDSRMKYVKLFAWAAWLGAGTIGLLGASITDWKWWVFILVLHVLVAWYKGIPE